MKWILSLITLCAVQADVPHHGASNTSWGKESVVAYSTHRHGPDGALFLDPYFIPSLEHLEGMQVLDAGCGAAPWSIYAAQHGATVSGIDIEKGMLELGNAAVQKAGLNDKISLSHGDVVKLPYPSTSFDLALSIFVGCNLSSPALAPHMEEMARSLRPGGTAVVVAPLSFGVVFTNGTPALQHIQDVLAALPPNPTSPQIVAAINQLKEVHRATFAVKDGHLTLITRESDLKPGEAIWRKLPGLTVPNNYHSEAEYLAAFASAGLTVKEAVHAHFPTKDAQKAYNASKPASQQLGDEYIDHNPFVVFLLTK